MLWVTSQYILPLKVLEKVALETRHHTGDQIELMEGKSSLFMQVIWEDCVDMVVSSLMSPILRNLYSFLSNMCI